MGIGYQALSLFDEILDKDYLKNCKSVIEMGCQLIDTQYQPRAKYILNKFNKKTKENVISAKNFYTAIGFNEYESIDASGLYGSKVFDLNVIIKDQYKFNKTYDLVTNFGTSEHVLNQKNVFENMHNLTKKNGYILHLLPFEGYFNHCYFNYHPSIFYDLATFNEYEIIGFWYFSERPTKLFKTYNGYNLYKALKYNNELMTSLDKLAKENKLICTPLSGGSSLGIMYKKINNNEFKISFDYQGGLIKDVKIDEYDRKKLKLNNESNINQNINHSKQIDEILGLSYWKIIIKNLVTDKNYRRKFISKILYKFFRYKNKYFSESTTLINN